MTFKPNCLNTLQRAGIGILCLVLFTVSLQAQEKKITLREYFSALRENQQFNGNVLVAENGKTVYEESFGYADFAYKTLNNKNTVFPIASLSKTIVATAILQLVEAGKLNLTKTVVNYLPGFPYPEITITHLLSHTSGLPPYNAYFDKQRKSNPGKVFTNADFLSGLVSDKVPLIYPPGEKGNYDNINYIVLALLLENVSGMPYKDYIEKNILKPAGMSHTVFFPLKQQYAQDKNVNFAFPHVYPYFYSEDVVKANAVPYIKSYWSAYDFHGFADYISTTEDLRKYDAAYNNGTLLNNAILQTAFEPVKLADGKNNPDNFGLGWEIEKDTSFGKLVYHSGMATGLSCILLRNITKHQMVIVFDNTHDNAHEIALNALKLLNGVPVPYPKKSVAKVYAKALLKDGAKAARDTLNKLLADTAHYRLSEYEMNLLGYNLMGGDNNPNPFHFPEAKRFKEALETFKLNAELFPGSWNVYDSYGEALLAVGRKDEAIWMYKKSIELNPGNEGGKKLLEEISN